MVGSQREDQYTPMGEIQMYGEFAAASKGAQGWTKWVLIGVAILVVAAVGIAAVLSWLHG